MDRKEKGRKGRVGQQRSGGCGWTKAQLDRNLHATALLMYICRVSEENCPEIVDAQDWRILLFVFSRRYVVKRKAGPFVATHNQVVDVLIGPVLLVTLTNAIECSSTSPSLVSGKSIDPVTH